MIIIGGALLLVLACFAVWQWSPKESTNVLKELQNKTGYIRTVGKEEYEFFEKLVKRDATEELSDKELEESTKAKINRVNAEFMLANQMGLCSPYSFESFLRDMENENSLRKLKKEKNEVFYGPESFNLITYYNYVSGNLKMDMVNFITENADKDVLNGAEQYFEDNKENYRTIEAISYVLTEDGNTNEKVLKREDMSSLEKTDAALFEFLYYGKENDTLQYVYNEILRDVKITLITYEELNFKNNKERVMRDYITNIYLEDLIRKTEEKNPVEFKLS